MQPDWAVVRFMAVHDADDFDAFYRATAARTMQYAYALCGDLARLRT